MHLEMVEFSIAYLGEWGGFDILWVQEKKQNKEHLCHTTCQWWARMLFGWPVATSTWGWLPRWIGYDIIYTYIYIQCVYVSVYCFDCLKPRILVFQVRGLLASLLFVTLEICWRRIPSESEQASNIRLVAVVPRFCPFHHRYVTLGHCSLAILHYCYYFCLVVPF